MTKRIFVISAVLLVLLAGAIFVYNFAFKKSSPGETGATPKTTDEGKSLDNSKNNPVTKSGSGTIIALTDQAVFGAALAADQNFIYYFSANSGQVNQIDYDGKLEKVISTEGFQNIQKIAWNKQKNKALVQRENGPDKSKYLFLDLSSKKISPLKDNLDSIAWSNLGDKIIYKHYDSKTKKRTLNISDPDGANWRKIADTNYIGLEISPAP